MDPLPYDTDHIIDPAMARALHADACRDHALVAWIVLWDLPAYPEQYAAGLATSSSPLLLTYCWLNLLLADRHPGDAAS